MYVSYLWATLPRRKYVRKTVRTVFTIDLFVGTLASVRCVWINVNLSIFGVSTKAWNLDITDEVDVVDRLYCHKIVIYEVIIRRYCLIRSGCGYQSGFWIVWSRKGWSILRGLWNLITNLNLTTRPFSSHRHALAWLCQTQSPSGIMRGSWTLNGFKAPVL